jgi:hypothetical protein
MDKFIKTSLTAILITIAAVTFNSSCKKQFDAPPAYVAPSITANTTIRQLKAMHTVVGKIDNITTDIIIRGIVIGDDKSGNLYKSIVIQDASGGILIRLEGTSLYTSYPIGQEVFIKCNGLFLGDYNNLIQLGGGADLTVTPASLLTLPSALFSQYIVKGSAGNIVVPKSVTVSQLGTSMQDTLQNVLIKLNNFEFAAADTSKTYANATTNPPGTVNFVLKDCSSSSITLRNSGFADFAAIGVPNGNGSIVSIYTVFGSTKQLTIRDTADLQMYGARCGGGGGVTPPPVGGTLLSETFESQTVPAAAPFNPISVAGWTNLDEVGGRKFESRVFSNNKYAQLSAFGSTQAVVTSWLVTKGIDLGSNTTKTLTFGTSGGFANGATLKVLVSSNFTGTGNPWATGVTWTDITAGATLCTIPSSGYFSGFTPSGNVSLNSYSGTIYIAFKYEGADPTGTGSDKTTTWQVDNILVTGN